MEKRTFAIHTLGCKVNTYESDMMSEALKAAGFMECGFSESADVYIINTCTVTNVADRKSRQMLRRARSRNPEALIVAAGCYVDDARKNGQLEGLIADGVIDLALSNKDKKNAAELIKQHFSDMDNENIPGNRSFAYAGAGPGGTGDGGDEAFAAGPAKPSLPSAPAEPAADAGGGPGSPAEPRFLTGLDGHTRAFIKVQDGCNMFCSYCVIPYVRGKVTIRPNEDTLREIRYLAENGVAEVVITGIHLTSMGGRLPELLKEIDRTDGIKRIRLGSLEPNFINERTAAELGSVEKLCPHFHLSLQSGSDRVLRAMNRHYTTRAYAQSCGLLREVYGHPAITTDIIVGFPGETEEMFSETLDFAEYIGFYEAHVFKYSRRRGTAADAMPGQLPEAVKQERSARLIQLTTRMSEDFRRYYLGRQTSFISEELTYIDGTQYETGYTPEYVRAVRPAGVLHQNELIKGTCSQILQQNNVDATLLLE